MKRLLIILLVLAALLAACSSAAVRNDLTYQGTYDSYKAFLENWTRSDRLYHNFSTELIISATYFSLPMRRAFVAEWVRSYDLPPSEQDKLLQEQMADAGRSVEFIVAFYTAKFSFNDLDEPDSTWRLWLIDAQGNKVAPSKIERMKIKHEKEIYFFPTYTEWNRLYRAVFPALGDDGKPLVLNSGTITLRATSVEGKVDLVWEIPEHIH